LTGAGVTRSLQISLVFCVSDVKPPFVAERVEKQTRVQCGNPVIEETIVALSENVKFEERARYTRGTGRLNSRVAVAIEWTEADRTLRAEGYTIDIGPKGCLAVLPQGFAVGQKLRLVNLTNQISAAATLAWRGHEGRTGWELGLELQDPSPDFWGLDF
jgi:hypothetical protein